MNVAEIKCIAGKFGIIIIILIIILKPFVYYSCKLTCIFCTDFTEYSIERGNDGRVFAVNLSTGSLYVVGKLSYNRQRVCMIIR